MGKLEGKVAIVTGGDSGMGRASAILMAKEGAKVVVANMNEKQGKEVETEINKAGGKATFFRTDVTKPENVEAMVQTAVEKYGRLDILFNNAGLTGPRDFTADYPVASWQKLIDLDLTGVFLGMKYGIPAMLKSGGGSIINTSSTGASKALPGFSAYCAAKAGVVMLTKTTAVEYGSKGIRVNTILPGGILTPMFKGALEATGEAKNMDAVNKLFPIGRLGQSEDVANLVLFLACDDSSYITGTTIYIDGGYTAV